MQLIAEEGLSHPLLLSQFWQGGPNIRTIATTLSLLPVSIAGFVALLQSGAAQQPKIKKGKGKAAGSGEALRPADWLRNAHTYADVTWGPHASATKQLADALQSYGQ